MKRENLKRVFAALLMLVLCLSLTPMAYADTTPGTNNGTVTKSIIMSKEGTVPAVTYTYSFTKSGTDIPATGSTPEILGSGPDISAVTIPFTNSTTTVDGSASNTVTTDTTKKSATQTAAITIPAAAAFGAPGVYRYTMTETSSPASTAGLVEETPQTRTLDVYVGYKTGETALSVLGTVLHKSTAAGVTAADKSIGFVANYTTNSLSISKTVTGAMGSRDKYFTFTVDIAGANGLVFPLTGVDANPTGMPANPTTVTGGTQATIYLKHSQTAVISGLPPAATYTVTETAVAGYTTAVIADGSTINGSTVTGDMAAVRTIAYTNNYGFTPPTGIALDIAPYAALVLLAALGLALPAMRKKKAQR